MQIRVLCESATKTQFCLLRLFEFNGFRQVREQMNTKGLTGQRVRLKYFYMYLILLFCSQEKSLAKGWSDVSGVCMGGGGGAGGIGLLLQ